MHDDKAKLLKNDKVYNHLITATRDGAREIVEDNRPDRSAYRTYQEILETYTDTDSNKADLHRMEFNKVPSIDPHADPLSTLRLLRKHARRVKQCDASQAVSDKEIIMRMVSLRPECKADQVGTVEYEIAKHYESFKIRSREGRVRYLYLGFFPEGFEETP